MPPIVMPAKATTTITMLVSAQKQQRSKIAKKKFLTLNETARMRLKNLQSRVKPKLTKKIKKSNFEAKKCVVNKAEFKATMGSRKPQAALHMQFFICAAITTTQAIFIFFFRCT